MRYSLFKKNLTMIKELHLCYSLHELVGYKRKASLWKDMYVHLSLSQCYHRNLLFIIKTKTAAPNDPLNHVDIYILLRFLISFSATTNLTTSSISPWLFLPPPPPNSNGFSIYYPPFCVTDFSNLSYTNYQH
jgi:hypothetical protein